MSHACASLSLQCFMRGLPYIASIPCITPSPDYGDVQDEDLPAPSTSPAEPDGRERPSPLCRSDSPKRTKLGEESCGEVELEDDDSWLRYSSPGWRQGGDDDENAEEKTEEKEEEVVLSRFASRIDGDCVAVTGLGGERVYAKKVCRGSDEGLVSRMSYSRAKSGLLVEPVNILFERSENEAFAKGSFSGTLVITFTRARISSHCTRRDRMRQNEVQSEFGDAVPVTIAREGTSRGFSIKDTTLGKSQNKPYFEWATHYRKPNGLSARQLKVSVNVN